MPTNLGPTKLDCRRECNMSSPLLALRPELQNRIYHYVASEHSARLTTRCRGEKSHLSPKSSRIVEFRERKSLGLTQVCTHLREEFLPLHLASLQCSVHSRESAAYVATFYPYWLPQNCSASADLEDLAYNTHDFLPILRLHSVGVKVRWSRLEKDRVRVDREMCLILSIGGSNRAWSEFLKLKVSKFEYRVGVSTSLKLVVKSSAKEPWMPWDAQTDVDKVSAETRQAMARWKIFNGMGHLKKMPHILIEEE